MTGRVNYKVLIFIPILLSLLLIPLILMRGIPQGIDFRGGTWVEIYSEKGIEESDLGAMEEELLSLGLEDLRIYLGREEGTERSSITIETTTEIDEEDIRPVLERHLGELRDMDLAILEISKAPPLDLEEKLRSRLGRGMDIAYDENSSTLSVTAFDLDWENLETAVEYYLEEDITIDKREKNINVREVGATLGARFRDQGISALIYAYILITLVVLFAFRDLIPSMAVILAATCDALIAAGGMSLFGILLEPASLVAILMLIGYSVDSDILLTTRVMKRRTGTVNERIDGAMKTGLTMSITTIIVMAVIIVVSSTIVQISTLLSIASVLLIGLTGDLITTWLMNAGILKWYMEEKGGKLPILRRRIRRR